MPLNKAFYKSTDNVRHWLAQAEWLPSDCVMRCTENGSIDMANMPHLIDHVNIVVQYRALQGGWKKKKLSENDKLSGLGDTRVNNCTVLIFNYLILFS